MRLEHTTGIILPTVQSIIKTINNKKYDFYVGIVAGTFFHES